MKRRNQIVLGLALAAVLLWLFLRQADLGEVARQVAGADVGLLALATAVSVATTVLRAWRWQYLLAPLDWLGLRTIWECTIMGWAITTVLPGRLGEIARPLLLARREGLSRSAALATVLLERIFDVAAVAAMLAGYLAFFPLPTAVDDQARAVVAALRSLGIAALALLVLFAVALLWAWFGGGAGTVKGWASALVARLPRRFGRPLAELGDAFAGGLAMLRQPRLVVVVALQSVLLWATIASVYWILFHALEVEVPGYATFPLVVIVVLGVMVPTPAAVGSFHAAARVGLATLWGVPTEVAVGYAIVSHAVAFVPLAVLGLPLLWLEGLSIREIERLEGEARDASVD